MLSILPHSFDGLRTKTTFWCLTNHTVSFQSIIQQRTIGLRSWSSQSKSKCSILIPSNMNESRERITCLKSSPVGWTTSIWQNMAQRWNLKNGNSFAQTTSQSKGTSIFFYLTFHWNWKRNEIENVCHLDDRNLIRCVMILTMGTKFVDSLFVFNQTLWMTRQSNFFSWKFECNHHPRRFEWNTHTHTPSVWWLGSNL